MSTSVLAHETGSSSAIQAEFQQLLGNKVASDAEFREADGRQVTLGGLFGVRPLVLVPAYYGCPKLCPVTLRSLPLSMAKLDMRPGKQFEVAVLGIDPREGPADAAEMQKKLVREADAVAQSWHYLTGDEVQIRRVAESIGFQYQYDESSDEYAHPAGLVLIAPDGRVTRYFAGIEFPPRDLKFALIDSADGRIGSVTDRLFLLCYDYDPETGKYAVTILSALFSERKPAFNTACLRGGSRRAQCLPRR